MGILLILIGIGIPLVLAFFQDDGKLNLGSPTYKVIERKLTPTEIEAIEEKMAAKEAWRKALDNKLTKVRTKRMDIIKLFAEVRVMLVSNLL